ncbi:MAG: 30S ribosomal protein S16 [Bdellovibrionales bacterium RIFOXYB1_FULL_37_110]|nr:MAG: 30S ribosomal protein S16 [Bdellovibrionales bacterium RIFOXYC1_FULL_37_79]OFZ56524.1 MAG: 30S ribosomal protein S16 [Bdellovibrionales bacterium RIFOXYB2_FULL_36_6]OFZ61195.1 MAG: 30S ribosomal protein S16 [Bdellovibrionales bacterium RIFOXYB1_FULL_37_110]OFZ65523.1 MAG: 30S ribosomal protein S16 [Bdellovibrionales bacterium RIFOXYD1_FULL_36_51]
MIKIRLARRGRVHTPIYSIVAIDSRSARDSRCLEQLGQYVPTEKEVLKNVKAEQISAWVDKGAVLSDTVKSLFKKNNIKI